jgi:hypothetical protein
VVSRAAQRSGHLRFCSAIEARLCRISRAGVTARVTAEEARWRVLRDSALLRVAPRPGQGMGDVRCGWDSTPYAAVARALCRLRASRTRSRKRPVNCSSVLQLMQFPESSA